MGEAAYAATHTAQPPRTSERVYLTPVYTLVRRIELWASDEVLLLVGANEDRTQFKVLRIDRGSGLVFHCAEERQVYSSDELAARLVVLVEKYPGLHLVAEAHGVVGVVKLLSGHYINLIMAKRYVGNIAGHAVFAITKTALYQVTAGARPAGDEAKYVQLLKSVDLHRNFFFSYTYDLSRSLQANLRRPSSVPATADEPRLGVVECQNRFVWNVYLLQHMLRQVGGGASPTPTHTHWVLPIIHGFFKQKSLHLQRSARVDITLVSRRSRHFAGTRYLRRGVNADGDVANEVETEQVVWRADAGEHGRGRVASVVQLRGSVPIMWSHANLSHPKPDIVVKPPTEGVPLSRRHFEQLAARYKLPVICLSLVKQVEKRPKEQLLAAGFEHVIKTLNDDVSWCEPGAIATGMRGTNASSGAEHRDGTTAGPAPHPASVRIRQDVMRRDSGDPLPLLYITFDFLGCSKSAGSAAVMSSLDGIASVALRRVGMLRATLGRDACAAVRTRQVGVLRTNCVDCLDRTNIGQFCFGKVALREQLMHVGLPFNNQQFDVVWPLLLAMYSEHGDAMAKQYAGSAAMHKATARQTEGKSSGTSTSSKLSAVLRGNMGNALTAIQRYVSNNFTDATKQSGLDLFLGAHVPTRGYPTAWAEVPTAKLSNGLLATVANANAARETARKNDLIHFRTRQLRRFSNSVTDMVVGGGDEGDNGGAAGGAGRVVDDSAVAEIGGSESEDSGCDSDSDEDTPVSSAVDSPSQATNGGVGAGAGAGAGADADAGVGAQEDPPSGGDDSDSDAALIALPLAQELGIADRDAPPIPPRRVPADAQPDVNSDLLTPVAASLASDPDFDPRLGLESDSDDAVPGVGAAGDVDDAYDSFAMVDAPPGRSHATPGQPFPHGTEIPVRVSVVRVWEHAVRRRQRQVQRQRRRRRGAPPSPDARHEKGNGNGGGDGDGGDGDSGGAACDSLSSGLDAQAIHFASKYQIGRRTHLPNRPPSPPASGGTGAAGATPGVHPLPKSVADAPAAMRGTFTTRQPRRRSVADFADALGLDDWRRTVPARVQRLDGLRRPPTPPTRRTVSNLTESSMEDDLQLLVPGGLPRANQAPFTAGHGSSGGVVSEQRGRQRITMTGTAGHSGDVAWLWDPEEERDTFEAFVAVLHYMHRLRHGDAGDDEGGSGTGNGVGVGVGVGDGGRVGSVPPPPAIELWQHHCRARQAFDAFAMGGPSPSGGPQDLGAQVLAWLASADADVGAEGITWELPEGYKPPTPAHGTEDGDRPGSASPRHRRLRRGRSNSWGGFEFNRSNPGTGLDLNPAVCAGGLDKWLSSAPSANDPLLLALASGSSPTHAATTQHGGSPGSTAASAAAAAVVTPRASRLAAFRSAMGEPTGYTTLCPSRGDTSTRSNGASASGGGLYLTAGRTPSRRSRDSPDGTNSPGGDFLRYRSRTPELASPSAASAATRRVAGTAAPTTGDAGAGAGAGAGIGNGTAGSATAAGQGGDGSDAGVTVVAVSSPGESTTPVARRGPPPTPPIRRGFRAFKKFFFTPKDGAGTSAAAATATAATATAAGDGAAAATAAGGIPGGHSAASGAAAGHGLLHTASARQCRSPAAAAAGDDMLRTQSALAVGAAMAASSRGAGHASQAPVAAWSQHHSLRRHQLLEGHATAALDDGLDGMAPGDGAFDCDPRGDPREAQFDDSVSL